MKQTVTFIKKSELAYRKLKENEDYNRLPELNVISCSNVGWNTHVDMFERLIAIEKPLNETLYELNEKHLFITEPMLFQLRALVRLLIPFRDFSETVSGEKYVTASLIKGSLIKLK
ncbi:unnamed protein product, partial [Meganyctiphanes norvegica]